MAGYSAQGSVVIRRIRKGADGRDSVRYYLTVSPQNFTVDTYGNIKESDKNVTVQAWTCIGSGTPAKANDNDVYLTVVPVSANGTKGSAIFAKSAASCTFTVSKTYSKYIVTLYDGATKNNEWDSQEVLIGNDGDSAVRIDLDNENDSILYNGAGERVSDEVSTIPHLYYGSVEKTSEANWSIASSSNVTLKNSSWNGGALVVTGVTENTGSVTVQAEYPKGSGKKYTCVFSIKRIVGVDKYELDISPNAISYNSTDGTNSGNVLTIRVWRTQQNGKRENILTLPTGYTLLINGTNYASSYKGKGYYQFTASVSSKSHLIVLTDGANILDSETIPVLSFKDGKSPYKMDLTNENTVVNCDYDGNPLSGAKYETSKVQILHGISDGYSDFTVVVEADGIKHGYNTSTHILNPSDITKDTATITVTATGKSGTEAAGITLQAVMTISKNKPGQPGETPVMYSLIPSHGVIHKDKDGGFIDTNMSFKVLKVEGTTETILDSYAKLYQNGLMIYCDGVSTAINANNTSNSSVVITCSKYFTSDHEEFVLKHFSNEVDREGIDCVYDGQTGEDGEPAVIVSFSSDYSTIPCNSNGVPEISTIKFTAMKRVGNNTPTDITSSDGYQIVVLQFAVGATAPGRTNTSYISPFTVSLLSNISYLTASIYYNSKVIQTLIIRTTKAGASGDDYLPFDNGLYADGKTYVWNSVKRDFVDYEFDGVYYRYGVKYKGMSVSVPPSNVNGDSNWEQAHVIKTLITNCIFGTNANLGGFLASNQRFLSSQMAYSIRYLSSYSSNTTYYYQEPNATNGLSAPRLDMVLYGSDYYVPKSAGSFSGKTPSASSDYWRLATSDEIKCSINGYNSVTELHKLELNGLDGIIKLLHADGYKWEVTTEGVQMLGVDSGRHIEIDPNRREFRIYDDKGDLSVTFDGESISSLSKLFSGSTPPNITFSQSSYSNQTTGKGYTGSSTDVTQKTDEILISNSFTTSSPGKMTVKGTLGARSNRVLSDPATAGGLVSGPSLFTDVPYYEGGYWYVNNNASATLIVKSYNSNGILIQSSYITACYADGRSSWVSQNVNRDVTLPAGTHYIYVRAEYRLLKGTSNWGYVRWTNISATFVYDYYISRIFANGLVFGSSQNNFFSAMRESDGNMAIKGVTNNGKYGFEVLSTGLSDIAGGQRLKKTVVLGFGYVLCRNANGTYTDIVTAQDAFRSYAGAFSCTRIAEGVHRLKYPDGWKDIITASYRIFVTALGYNNTTYNNKSVNNVNTTVTVKEINTTDCVIVVGDDMSPNDLFGFHFKIEYMLD